MNYIISKIGYFLTVGICGLPIIGCAGMAEVSAIPTDPAAALSVPAGFKVQVFAKADAAGSTYFSGPRFMAFDAAGNLYLSTGMQNKVVMLPDRNKDGVADAVVTVADKLNAPQGLAFVDGKLLVANQDGVVRLEQKNGRWGTPVPLIKDLATGGHTLKTIRLGPDGYLYLNVGSSCNVCEESDATRATILRYTTEGKPAGAVATVGSHAPSAIWASGLRNSQSFTWHPRTHVMFATNNGADMRSDTKGGKVNDELPPENLNIIEAGKNYGWPHCWTDPQQNRQVTDANFPGEAGFCATTQAPAITFTSHSTPLGITFLDKAAFPGDYKDDAIVALHGSWNREQPSGYKLVRVKFRQEKPVEVIDFATGWLNTASPNKSAATAWGRPTDVIIGPDGALYVSDDRAGMVYRITYDKGTAPKKATPNVGK